VPPAAPAPAEPLPWPPLPLALPPLLPLPLPSLPMPLPIDFGMLEFWDIPLAGVPPEPEWVCAWAATPSVAKDAASAIEIRAFIASPWFVYRMCRAFDMLACAQLWIN
jgi:hypothetical protein